MSSLDRLTAQVDRLGGDRLELRRLQRLIKQINKSLRCLVVFADGHQLPEEDIYTERLQEMVDAMKEKTSVAINTWRESSGTLCTFRKPIGASGGSETAKKSWK